jgi:putative ABC transport system permease protein
VPSQPGIGLVVALVVLLGLAVGASALGRFRTERSIAVAAVRAVVQLAVVSLVIAFVLRSVAWSLLFAALMFGVAVFTTSRRVGAPGAWPWAAVAVASGVLPALVVIFATRSVPFNGPSLVPFAGIVIGGAMNANSLAGRRAFAALRDDRGTYEAALSIGLYRADAIAEVVHDLLPEALVPGMDQTRTVGLVTLPGAFVGVMLGGGSPVQAGAAQVLVLVGLLAAQTITVLVAGRLICAGRLLPADLAGSLRP